MASRGMNHNMKRRMLTVVVVLGLVIGFMSLWNMAVATAMLFLNGMLVGVIAAGTSEKPIRNILRAIGWGWLVLVVASLVLGSAKLAGYYGDWAWTTAPESAVLAIWVGGCLMMSFWLVLGNLIRLLK